jgi:hypothetical protein
MTAAEVYYVLCKIIDSSRQIFQEKKQDNLRWHVPIEQSQYTKTIKTFLDCYFEGVVLGERSLVKFCRENHFDFTKLIDSGFRSLMTNYLDLNCMSDAIVIFLTEGQKSLIRFQYAVLKIHKDFIKEGKDVFLKMTIQEALEQQARAKTTPEALLYWTFKYKLATASSYKYSQKDPAILNIDFADAHKTSSFLTLLPTKSITSDIINFEQLSVLWMLLP